MCRMMVFYLLPGQQHTTLAAETSSPHGMRIDDAVKIQAGVAPDASQFASEDQEGAG